MKWTEACATGSTEIDKHHKALFLMSEQFREALDAGQGEATYDIAVEFLNFYSDAHFSFEENCMLAHLCPAAGQNEREHCLFKLIIKKEMKRLRRDGFDRAIAYKLLDKVDGWLESHIGRVDVQLKDVIDPPPGP